MITSTIHTPIGPLRLDASEGALVGLSWIRGPSAPAAEDPPSDPLIAAVSAQLQAYFAGQLTDFRFALRPRGSPFQHRIWALLRTIPFGTTLSYAALAARADTAPRAAAAACAANPIPIVIPCHRVIAASGALAGYSGGDGIATKRFLLNLEQAPRHPVPIPATAAQGDPAAWTPVP
ncbi:MAG: methylated-DNA--[protein]-cysteine S-methyltransferase [Rhodospirillales bacterium]|nr:MAG: methylated-DNA--[protein]-cysteine S-methyltransferase [Rhodospirillales bacterium]